MISGVRGSPFGGRPGRLYIRPIEGPQKISPMPAILLTAGDAASSIETASAVWLESLSQSSATSSSVGPIWPPDWDSESGSSVSMIEAGSLGGGILRNRLESIGD